MSVSISVFVHVSFIFDEPNTLLREETNYNNLQDSLTTTEERQSGQKPLPKEPKKLHNKLHFAKMWAA